MARAAEPDVESKGGDAPAPDVPSDAAEATADAVGVAGAETPPEGEGKGWLEKPDTDDDYDADLPTVVANADEIEGLRELAKAAADARAAKEEEERKAAAALPAEPVAEGPPIGLIVGGFVLLGVVGVVLVAMGLGGLFAGQPDPEPVHTAPVTRSAPPIAAPVAEPVKIEPVEADEAEGDEPDEEEPDAEEPDEAEATPPAAADTQPRVSEKAPTKQPQTPRVRTKAKTKPEPEPAGKKSTIQVSSNRRALVYLDGKPVGYTPQTLRQDAGAYRIGVMLPGRKDTLKEQTVRVDGSGKAVPVEVNF